MAQEIASRALARSPGVYFIPVPQPKIVSGVSLGRIGIAMQCEWGPVLQATQPGGAEFYTTYFPVGSKRTSTGWLATTNRYKPVWSVCRVLHNVAGILPPDPPNITQAGTPGAVTVKYLIVAKNAAGDSQGSAVAITTTSNATLDNTNFNTLTWSAVTGATSYDVYRTSASGLTPSTTGKVANVSVATYSDKGDAGDASTAPTTNGTGYTQGVCYLLDSDGNAVMKFVAKYPGTMINSCTIAVADATDGNADHFNATLTLTDSNTGTTTESYRNLSSKATAVLLSASDLSSSILLASNALVNVAGAAPTTRPANGTYSFSGGSNGAAITATDYDTAFAALNADSDVVIFGNDDCGDSIRAAVNANGVTREQQKSDRIYCPQSLQASDWSTVKTEVASYRDKHCRFATWVNTLDVTGTEQLTPLWTFIATANTNLEPQIPAAWRSTLMKPYFSGISSIPNNTTGNNFDTTDATDGGVRDTATEYGICLPIKYENGNYGILHDRTTSLAVSERFVATQLIIRYLDKLLAAVLEEYTNGVNGADDRRQAKMACDSALKKEAGKRIAIADDITVQSYPDWAEGEPMFTTSITGVNDSDSIAAGEFAIKLDGVTPSVMEKIFVLRNVGTAPTVR